MYLSILFLSTMSASEERRTQGDPFDEGVAAQYALSLCNYDFCSRWDDLDRNVSKSVDDVKHELVSLYEVASEYNVKLPFPLRTFVKAALQYTGRVEKVLDWQIESSSPDEPCFLIDEKENTI